MNLESMIDANRKILVAQIETLSGQLQGQVALLTPERALALYDSGGNACIATSDAAKEALQTLGEIAHRSLLLADMKTVKVGMTLGNLRGELATYPETMRVVTNDEQRPNLKQNFHVFQPITRHAAFSSFPADFIRRPTCGDIIHGIDRCVDSGLRDWLDRKQQMCYETPVWINETRTHRGSPVVEVRQQDGCVLIVAGDNQEFAP